jgi:hypothetical protein
MKRLYLCNEDEDAESRHTTSGAWLLASHALHFANPSTQDTFGTEKMAVFGQVSATLTYDRLQRKKKNIELADRRVIPRA